MIGDGVYKTEAGSLVTIRRGWLVEIDFDWFEEDDACMDCSPSDSLEDGRLIWYCDYCDGGSAKLFKKEKPQ